MKEKNRKRARSGVWSLLERMLQGVWRYRLLCLLLIIAAMVTTSALMHPGKLQSATALIALNYEEATRGLYPNQTRFNISLLKSDEVLSRALEKAGVTNMESLALAEHISVSASSVGGMSIDSGSASAYKIATTYTVSYKRNEELPASISTGDMLQLIIEAYKEVFYENYTYVDTALNPNWNELDELEYVEIGTFFEKEIGKVSRFLKSRANENGTFRSSANNETFTSLQKKAQNFSNIDLEKYSAYVRQSGLSKNRDRYVSKLKYQNQLRNIEYQKFMSHYQNHLATIDMYDSALTSVVLIPTLDTQASFYMSRTKVAIDYQASSAETENFHAHDTKEKIKDNEYTIEKMLAEDANAAENIVTAEMLIDTMKTKLADLIERTNVINREYVRYKTRNYLTVSYEQMSAMDEYSIKWSILMGGVTFCACCVLLLVIEGRKKHEKV